ncbi:hypothetical protein K3727_17190 [Rhodobacteraceae bacterium M382]|nr:hypothetical protein K3727_17190 [Rhodobacteraceae bacterium M382]
MTLQSPAFAPLSERSTASTDTEYDKDQTSVAALADGGFVIVWVSDGQDTSGKGVYGQRFSANGDRVGEEFRINTYTNNDQWQPAVSGFETGGFVVTWTSEGQDGSEGGVYAQRFDVDGEKLGVETRVSSPAVLDQSAPDVVTLPDGSYMIAWQAEDGDGDRVIYAQAFDPEGAKIGLRRIVSANDMDGNPDDTAQKVVLEALESGEIVAGWVSENVPAFRVFEDLSGEMGNVFYGERERSGSSGYGTTEAVAIVPVTDQTFVSYWEQYYYVYSSPASGSSAPGGSILSAVFDLDGSIVGDTDSRGYRALLPDFVYDPQYDQIARFGSTYTQVAYEAWDVSVRGEIVGESGTIGISLDDAFDPSVSLTTANSVLVGWHSRTEPTIEFQLFATNGATTGSVRIEGEIRIGATLTAIVEDLSDPDGVASQSYQWTREGEDIAGETGTSFTLTERDIDASVGVRLTVIDGKGVQALGSAYAPVILGDHFFGTELDDTLSGTRGGDLIEGLAGNDTIDSGVGGPDTILGGAGNDSIFGEGFNHVIAGDGDDTISGPGDYATVLGGNGNDHITLYANRGVISGGPGQDTLRGGWDASLSGGEGDDLIYGGVNSTVTGGLGRDEIILQGGSNLVNPGEGEDTIYLSDAEAPGDVVMGSSVDLDGDVLTGFAAQDAVVIENEVLLGAAVVELVDGNTRFGISLQSEPTGELSLLFEGDVRENGIEVFQKGDDIGIGVRSIPDAPRGTVRGNVFANTIVETTANQVFGGAGDDLITTSDFGSSQLFGEDGNDTVISGPATELLEGGAGNDSLVGNDGDDTLQGNDGNDTSNGGYGNDLIAGGTGDDLSFGGHGVDRLFGGEGNDTLFGEPDNDSLTGGAGNDSLIGGGHSDELFGEDGEDTLDGGSGNDRLLGDAGDDSLDGGSGSDTLNGGAGDDTILGGPHDDDLRDVIYAGEGNDSVDAGAGNDLVFGQDGNDTIAGGAGVDELQGQDGDDVITGSAFSDLVFGGAGNDFVNGGFGHDRINGGSGADKFFHVGVEGHGSDWVQDYASAESDVLLWGGSAASASDFQVNLAHTENDAGERSGDDAVQEGFVIYKPTGQIIWALVDGQGQDQINLQIGSAVYDLLA